MLSRDTYPLGVKGPSSLCEFVTSSPCGHWYQSFLNKLSEVLHLPSSSYAIYYVRGEYEQSLPHSLLGEYERNTEFRRRTRRYNLTTSRIRHHGELTPGAAQSEDLCLANNFIYQWPFFTVTQNRTNKYHRIFFPQISTKWFPQSSLATTNVKFRVWFVKKSFFPYWIGFLFSISSDCLQPTVMIKTYQINWPLQMSPVAGTNLALGSNVKFKPGFQNPG